MSTEKNGVRCGSMPSTWDELKSKVRTTHNEIFYDTTRHKSVVSEVCPLLCIVLFISTEAFQVGPMRFSV